MYTIIIIYIYVAYLSPCPIAWSQLSYLAHVRLMKRALAADLPCDISLSLPSVLLSSLSSAASKSSSMATTCAPNRLSALSGFALPLRTALLARKAPSMPLTACHSTPLY